MIGIRSWRHVRRNAVLASVATLALLLAAVASPWVGMGRSGGTASAQASLSLTGLCGNTKPTGQTWKHIIWIWMENRSYDQVITNPTSNHDTDAPYINKTLVPQCGLAQNYHNITHYSLPNYMAATSGKRTITGDCLPATSGCHTSDLSLFSQMESTSGHSWHEYAESMPSNCDKTNAYPYVVRHTAPPYYTNLTKCGNWDVPLGTASNSNLINTMGSDANFASFVFVTPNLCDDMHGPDTSGATYCPTGKNWITEGDKWLSTWIPLMKGTASYQAGDTAIFITFDEGDNTNTFQGKDCYNQTSPGPALGGTGDEDCWVATLVVTPYTPAGAKSMTAFNHYGLAKTVEVMLHLSTQYLGTNVYTSTNLSSGTNPFNL